MCCISIGPGMFHISGDIKGQHNFPSLNNILYNHCIKWEADREGEENVINSYLNYSLISELLQTVWALTLSHDVSVDCYWFALCMVQFLLSDTHARTHTSTSVTQTIKTLFFCVSPFDSLSMIVNNNDVISMIYLHIYCKKYYFSTYQCNSKMLLHFYCENIFDVLDLKQCLRYLHINIMWWHRWHGVMVVLRISLWCCFLPGIHHLITEIQMRDKLEKC